MGAIEPDESWVQGLGGLSVYTRIRTVTYGICTNQEMKNNRKMIHITGIIDFSVIVIVVNIVIIVRIITIMVIVWLRHRATKNDNYNGLCQL